MDFGSFSFLKNKELIALPYTCLLACIEVVPHLSVVVLLVYASFVPLYYHLIKFFC